MAIPNYKRKLQLLRIHFNLNKRLLIQEVSHTHRQRLTPSPKHFFLGGGGGDFPTFWCRQTLLRMYLTIPVTSAPPESTFLPLDDLRTTLTDALSEIDITDTFDTKRFV